MRALMWAVATCAVVVGAQNASAQVRCTMPNGVVITQQLSNVCPSGAVEARTFDGAPAKVHPPTSVAAAPVVVGRNGVRSQEVTRQEFGGAWPLKVERGTLRCMYPVAASPQLRAYLIVVDGVPYTLNGTARSHAARMGWVSIHGIWLDSQAIPGTKVPISPLIERAAKLC